MKPVTAAAPSPAAANKPVDSMRWLPLRHLRTLQTESATAPGRLPHVSAASGLVKLGDRLFVAVDDERGLAMFQADRKGEWIPLLPGALPAESEARRAAKPDFEALAALPPFPGAPHGAL